MRISDWSSDVFSSDLGLFGLGPVPAVRQALERAGWTLGDVERVEVNEAFAAIVLAIIQEIGLPEDIVHVEGGARAHGHQIGATGAVPQPRRLHAMQRAGHSPGPVPPGPRGAQGG